MSTSPSIIETEFHSNRDLSTVLREDQTADAAALIHRMAKGESEDPQVMIQDDWRRVRAALQILPPDERECLELAVFLEYTHSEIFARLDTPLGTVKNRLRRALDKVRNQLSRYEF